MRETFGALFLLTACALNWAQVSLFAFGNQPERDVIGILIGLTLIAYFFSFVGSGAGPNQTFKRIFTFNGARSMPGLGWGTGPKGHRIRFPNKHGRPRIHFVICPCNRVRNICGGGGRTAAEKSLISRSPCWGDADLDCLREGCPSWQNHDDATLLMWGYIRQNDVPVLAVLMVEPFIELRSGGRLEPEDVTGKQG